MILRLNFARVPKKGYHLTKEKTERLHPHKALKIPNRQKRKQTKIGRDWKMHCGLWVAMHYLKVVPFREFALFREMQTVQWMG